MAGVESPQQFNAAVEQDLALLAQADNYVQWLASLALPHCRGRLLEIGSGIGTYSGYLIEACDQALLTDYDPRYVTKLNQRFSGQPQVEAEVFDLSQPPPQSWQGSFDTVVNFNVLEHVQDDQAALAGLLGCLRPGGRLVTLVPAMNWLMSSLDRSYGHHRRYGKSRVKQLAQGLGALIVDMRYYNLLGVAGWLKSMLVGAKTLSAKEVQTFDRRLVPLCRRMEEHIRFPLGLGLVFVLTPGKEA